MKNSKKKQRKVGGRVVEMEDEVVGLAWLGLSLVREIAFCFVFFLRVQCAVPVVWFGLLSISFRQPV